MHEIDALTTIDTLSVADVRQRFEDAGVSVSEWASANGLSPAVVYALLSGRVRGRRGEAHRAAVALGLKKGRCLEFPLALGEPLTSIPVQAPAEKTNP